MLIKKKRLASIRTGFVDTTELSETAKSAQAEINKAKEAAKSIKKSAEEVLHAAEKKLSEAEEKANEIVKRGNSEAQKIKESVYNQTLQIAQEEADLIRERSKALLKELFEVKQKALIQAHKEIIGVALDLAEKIIKYQANIDPDVLKTQVLEAIKKAGATTDRVQVYVNPQDVKTLENSIPEIKKLFPSGIDIIPLIHEAIDVGSCVVETISGQLDATFTTQLEVLKELVSHIEIKEPNIVIEEDFPTAKTKPPDIVDIREEIFQQEFIALSPEDIIREEIEPSQQKLQALPKEEKMLEELLGDEPLIKLEEESKVIDIPPIKVDNEIIDIPKEIIEERKKEEKKQEPKKPVIEDTEEVQPEIVQSETEEQTQPEISNEEQYESLFEFEDVEEEEPVTKEKKEVKLNNILKPKTKKNTSVSDIAAEIENNPEWKKVIEDEE